MQRVYNLDGISLNHPYNWKITMRNETDMMELIMNFARSREAIRAVVMNGSRVNPNARRDPFQDYDIACYVTEVDLFRSDPKIPDYFGEVMILQLPDEMGDPPSKDSAEYAYLMQFMDGNRIDLSFHPLERTAQIVEDSLSLVLLDKDGRVSPLPPPGDSSYLPVKPTAKAFADCCNEFWWVTPYAAKGLWRGELTYAHAMLDSYIRDQLMKMLTWYFGMRTDWQQSPGKYGKYLDQGVDSSIWESVKRTYADADFDHVWSALITTGDLFRTLALAVSEDFGFDYPMKEDQRVSGYIRFIQGLPANTNSL